MVPPASTPVMRSVLQVGDIAGVAAQLTEALRSTEWTAVSAPVSEVRRRARVLRMLDLPLRAMATRGHLRDAIQRSSPSIVHLHWARYAPFVDTGRVPLVVHCHGTDVRGRSRLSTGSLVRRSLNRAAAVVVATPDLVEWTVPDAIYLPNPIDTALFSPSTTSAARPTVLLFARLDVVKGGERLVAIGRELRRRAADVRVVAFAGGAFDDAAREAGIDVLPSTDRAGIVAALHASDVVVGQQSIPMLGLSELEAMACARPVVAPVAVDAYDIAPPVVVAHGVAATVERCLELLEQPGVRTERGHAGRAYVVANHSHEVVGARLARLYDGIVGLS